MNKTQELRQDDYRVDNHTEIEYGTIRDIEEVENIIDKSFTTVIAENRQDKNLMMKNRF